MDLILATRPDGRAPAGPVDTGLVIATSGATKNIYQLELQNTGPTSLLYCLASRLLDRPPPPVWAEVPTNVLAISTAVHRP